jgi:hypothetical protein
MDIGHLFLAIAVVVAFPAGCAFTERHRPEPIDPDKANLLDVADAYTPGWLPSRRPWPLWLPLRLRRLAISRDPAMRRLINGLDDMRETARRRGPA